MAHKPTKARFAGSDDIARGNTGTGDMGPGDVRSDDHVDTNTGRIKPRTVTAPSSLRNAKDKRKA